MLKSKISHQLSVLLLTTLSSVLPLKAVNSTTFQETEVEQEDFIAIAQPFGENKYNLIVIEQIPEKNSCWSENPTGNGLVNVDLLLLNFDFSGHCRRSTDANGYSIRYDGQDYGLDYLLSLVEKDGQVLLIGTNRTNSNQPPIIVGSSGGLNGQPMKIKLKSGWKFTKRTYDGQVLGHVYFSYDSVANVPEMDSEQILESTSEPMLEATPEPGLENTSEPMVETTPEPGLENTSEPMVETTPEPGLESTSEQVRISPSEPMPESTSKLLERLKNNPEPMPERTYEEPTQGTIREIVAPGIEPQKQMKKSSKIYPIINNGKEKLVNKKIQYK